PTPSPGSTAILCVAIFILEGRLRPPPESSPRKSFRGQSPQANAELSHVARGISPSLVSALLWFAQSQDPNPGDAPTRAASDRSGRKLRTEGTGTIAGGSRQ